MTALELGYALGQQLYKGAEFNTPSALAGVGGMLGGEVGMSLGSGLLGTTIGDVPSRLLGGSIGALGTGLPLWFLLHRLMDKKKQEAVKEQQ